MKKTTLTIFTIFHIIANAQISDYTNLLNGKVEKVIENTSFNTTIITKYNNNGLAKSQEIYNGNNSDKDSLRIAENYIIRLDKRNRICEIITERKCKNLAQIKIKQEVKYRPSYYIIKTLYKENGKWNADPFQKNKKYTYNHLEYAVFAELEGGLFSEHYKWSPDKLRILQKRFDTKEIGWNQYICNYKYDEKGRLMIKDHKEKIDSIYDMIFYEKKNGEVAQDSVYRSTKSDSYITEYIYDKQNNCIEEKTIYHDGSICIKSYDYIYDHYKNWTKKREYSNNNLTSVRKRKIKYYE